jgi:hypothetical protein
VRVSELAWHVLIPCVVNRRIGGRRFYGPGELMHMFHKRMVLHSSIVMLMRESRVCRQRSCPVGEYAGRKNTSTKKRLRISS